MYYFLSIIILQVLKNKRKLAALLSLSYRCIVSINVLWLFLTVLWVGLQYVFVVFPNHTHLFFVINHILTLCLSSSKQVTFKIWTHLLKIWLNIY